jgi:ubiquitin-conjugating enzyme E2 J2
VHVHVQPLPQNMLEWHFCIEGPAGSPYQGGFYHGVIRFPPEYPFKPPSIRMITQSRRFEPNQRICLSMSDFHPETWNCMWSVSSILQGVVSFMLDSAPAIGTITTSDAVKRQLARKSMMTNFKDKVFRELFEQLCEDYAKEHPGMSYDGLPVCQRVR